MALSIVLVPEALLLENKMEFLASHCTVFLDGYGANHISLSTTGDDMGSLSENDLEHCVYAGNVDFQLQ